MSDNTWLLEFYDECAEFIPDEILDEADELFGVDDEEEPPEEYYVWCARKYMEVIDERATEAVESTFRIVN